MVSAYSVCTYPNGQDKYISTTPTNHAFIQPAETLLTYILET